MTGLLNIMRRLEVTLLMRTGDHIVFRAASINTQRRPDNSLSALSAKGAPHFPLYVRLDAIDAVITRRVWRWL